MRTVSINGGSEFGEAYFMDPDRFRFDSCGQTKDFMEAVIARFHEIALWHGVSCQWNPRTGEVTMDQADSERLHMEEDDMHEWRQQAVQEVWREWETQEEQKRERRSG